MSGTTKCALCSCTTELPTFRQGVPQWMMETDNETLDSIPPNGQFICDDCETRFTKEDTFAQLFFKEKSFLKAFRSTDNIDGLTGVEIHSPQAKDQLLYLVTSLTLRQHLYLSQFGISLLGPAFARIANDYHRRLLIDNEYSYFVVKHLGLSQAISFPAKVRFAGLNAIETLLWGYRIVLLTDKQRLKDEVPLKEVYLRKDLVVPVDNGHEESYARRIIDYIEAIPKMRN